MESNLECMIFNWYAEDRVEDPDDVSEEEKYPEKFYHIYLFSLNEKGESICIDVTGFTPFFYVKIPDSWDTPEVTRLVGKVKNKLWKRAKYLVSYKVMYKKDAYGFNNQKKFKFIRFVFNNDSARKSVIKMFKEPVEGFIHIKFNLYNADIDPMLIFMHIRDIQASGWITINKSNLIKHKLSRCKHNYSVNWKNINPLDKHNIPPIKTLSFDLECFSSTGDFPDPTIKANQIIQVGSSIQRFGEDRIHKHVIVLGECDPIDGVEIVSVKTEEELIKKWAEYVIKNDPDQLIGYNIDDFDWTYLWTRGCMHGCEQHLEKLGRLYHIDSEFKKDKMESKAYGTNIFNYITTPGVGQIDLLHYFRKETKLESYKLDFVAELYLKENKRPVSPKDIFKMAGPKGTSRSRAIVADYCAQDTNLPLRLMDNRCMLPNLIEMSKCTYVPLSWLISRGQQIKVYSQIQKELRANDFVIPKIAGQGGYEGATVLNAERGYHYMVSGLDFKSLYPSIMIAHNLCPTTWVRLPKYDNIEGVEYKHFNWEDGNYKFVQNVEGIIPKILTRLWAERNRVKSLMKTEKDPRMKAVLNGKQLAIKVSMNSIYGFFGVGEGAMLACKPIASTVTYVGRKMIEHSRNCAENWYDGSEKSKGIKAHVIYGDSVSGDMPVTLKIKGGKYIIPKRIDSIHTTGWYPYNEFKSDEEDLRDKEQALCENTLVWSANGWVRIVRVIRHKVKKRLYRVVTRKGIVVVTEDHSLINKDNELVKPKDVVVGDKLLHRYIEKKTDVNNTYNIKNELQKAFYAKFI